MDGCGGWRCYRGTRQSVFSQGLDKWLLVGGGAGVTTRTIRRDLEALQSAGFPLYDEVHDGKRYWTLEQRAFKRLDDTGFTLAELSALYFSRTLVECLAATPFQQDVASAFEKLSAALTN